jgi:hypothetical protein
LAETFAVRNRKDYRLQLGQTGIEEGLAGGYWSYEQTSGLLIKE